MKSAVTMGMVLTILMSTTGALFNPEVGNHSPNPNFFKILKNSTPTNLDEVLAKLRWSDRDVNPYKTNPHGTNIPRD